eukprot:2224589-Pleurochrysis_carterae.AAC.1
MVATWLAVLLLGVTEHARFMQSVGTEHEGNCRRTTADRGPGPHAMFRPHDLNETRARSSSSERREHAL